jgi:hypothetical protein
MKPADHEIANQTIEETGFVPQQRIETVQE